MLKMHFFLLFLVWVVSGHVLHGGLTCHSVTFTITDLVNNTLYLYLSPSASPFFAQPIPTSPYIVQVIAVIE